MENNQDTSIFEFSMNEESKSHLSGIAQWTNINAIVGLVALGVSVISTVVAFGKASSYAGGSAAVGTGMVGLIISIGISLALNITLLAAASNLKKGLEQTDQGLFGIGLTKLATYFKIVGILTIIVLVIAVLFLLIALLAGAANSGL